MDAIIFLIATEVIAVHFIIINVLRKKVSQDNSGTDILPALHRVVRSMFETLAMVGQALRNVRGTMMPRGSTKKKPR
jgi:predicted proteasome-type protease